MYKFIMYVIVCALSLIIISVIVLLQMIQLIKLYRHNQIVSMSTRIQLLNISDVTLNNRIQI